VYSSSVNSRPLAISLVKTYSSTSVPRCALSSALITPSIGRWTSLAKIALSFIESSLLFQDVLGPVVLVVLQEPEQDERRPQRLGLFVAAGEEHQHRLTRHDALQIVQHVV